MQYLYYNSNHSITCDNCNREIRPMKDSVSFPLGVSLGFISIYLPGCIFVSYFNMDLLNAIIYSLPFFVIVETIVIIITFNNLHFK